MNEFSNIAEYSVQKTRSAAFHILKYALPIISIALSVVLTVLITSIYGLVFGILAFFLLPTCAIAYCVIRFRRIDYDYRMVGSELFFSIVYNRKKRKELGSVDITRFEKIAPYAGKYADEAESTEYDKVYDFSSSPNDPYVFYAIEYDEENNTKTLYLFNASEKMLKLIKLYNRRAITEYPNE